MKVSIQNLLGWNRSFSKPNGTSVSINRYEQLHLVDKDKHEKFYLGYRNYNYRVITQLEELVEDVVENSNYELTNKEEKVNEQQVVKEPEEVTPDEQEVINKVDEQVEEVVQPPEELTPTPDVDSLLRQMTVEELKSITNKLGIVTSANKVNMLVNKIRAAAKDDVILEAINSVKGDANA